MKYLLFGTLALLSVGLAVAQSDDDIFHGVSYNDDVTRKFNLDAAGVVEVLTDVRYRAKSQEEARAYYYIVPKVNEENLVSLTAVVATSMNEAQVKRVEASATPADIQKTLKAKNSTDEVAIFKISTKKDESSNGQVTFSIKELYKRRKNPFPSQIKIKDEQSVNFVDSKYYVSLYPTKTQKVTFSHNSPNLIFNTPDGGLVEKKKNLVRYGPYKNVEALSYSEVMLHYKANQPLPIFTEVKKTIEVSHWGNINVDEYYELFNEAAGIKGEFGRVDYQSWDPNRAQYAIKSLETTLPRYIRGLYYWDYIGNISTSNANRDDDHVTFRIEPRFPVFGQWKVDWSQGYNMPTRHHLFQNEAGRFIFNYTFDQDFSDILAENYTLNVILPEGATNLKVHLPFAVDSLDKSLYFSTLDFIGRPQITIKKANVISSLHKESFQVSYEMSANGLLIEPIFVIAFFFLCFLSAIVYARVDLSFRDDKKVKTQ